MTLPQDASSSDIFATIERYIAACRTELKGRFVDDSELRTLGPFIDWKALYESPVGDR
ncbi:hypothetical protein [Caballeronia grimmiae]|uniref:hypothetical protein n=1 Tax=Caballeronia grimmiae TaxID=1071679 RepID=UPI0038B81794